MEKPVIAHDRSCFLVETTGNVKKNINRCNNRWKVSVDDSKAHVILMETIAIVAVGSRESVA